MSYEEVPGIGKKKQKKVGDRPNRLILQKSPYLRQHAFNPVDWYPWGEEAFSEARRLDRPVFLSIGYSTCHWCHVMAHESFEDQEVARLMNDAFVSVKVDREERPEIDQIYMKVCQMMTGRGGWPLTILMTPDKKPFFVATYLPKRGRFGTPGMLDILTRIRELWNEDREELFRSAEAITDRLRAAEETLGGEGLGRPTLKAAYDGLLNRFDWLNGGFGTAPKFPTPHNLLFLLRCWRRTQDKTALEMVETTLRAMRSGGIYDHLGFGFHRYSTDSRWLLPHFEKMLYDQALTAMAYTEAYQATSKGEYSRTAREILNYVLREMTSQEGVFFSAEDADSEGDEGRFYLWSREEICQSLPPEEADLVIKLFGVEEEGNFSEEASGRRTGRNVLSMKTSLEDAASTFGLAEEALRTRLEKSRERLFEARRRRVRPARDDKVLTDWNGLMIAAMAKAGTALEEVRYVEAAGKAAEFLLERMRPKGVLLHRYKDGGSAFSGNLEDYAFLVWGLIELYEATFEAGYLRSALELNSQMIDGFWDDDGGGLFFTSRDAEGLIARQKLVYDGAVPSGNSVAMLNLLRLGRMTGNSELEDRAWSLARAFSIKVMLAPEAHTQLMVALDFALGPSYEIVVVGRPGAEDTKAMLGALRSRFLPEAVTILVPEGKEREIHSMAEFSRLMTSLGGRATAYVCTGGRCELPTTDVDKMLEQLVVK